MTSGHVAEGFEEVRREFERNFERRRELGAACAAFKDGELLVDLWGGVRDSRTKEPWERDTVVLVFSTTKGLAAMTLALLHARGALDYDERVSTYWPDFGQAAKQDVTVRQLLGHQAGLAVVDAPLDSGMLADHDRLARAIAGQKPAWQPGTRHGYHGLSIGWYAGELVRRTDPQSRTLGRFFAEEIAGPLGLDLRIGGPDFEPRRLARIERTAGWRVLVGSRELPPAFALAMANRRSASARAFSNPRLRGLPDLDSTEFRTVEIPAAGGVGGAADIARAYAAFASDPEELGVGPGILEELTRDPVPPTRGTHDAILKVPTSWSLGFARPTARAPFGSSPRAFGHPGAGGSFAFADPDRGVSFAYVTNRMGYRLVDDPREKALRDAVYRCLDAA